MFVFVTDSHSCFRLLLQAHIWLGIHLWQRQDLAYIFYSTLCHTWYSQIDCLIDFLLDGVKWGDFRCPIWVFNPPMYTYVRACMCMCTCMFCFWMNCQHILKPRSHIFIFYAFLCCILKKLAFLLCHFWMIESNQSFIHHHRPILRSGCEVCIESLLFLVSFSIFNIIKLARNFDNLIIW